MFLTTGNNMRNIKEVTNAQVTLYIFSHTIAIKRFAIFDNVET